MYFLYIEECQDRLIDLPRCSFFFCIHFWVLFLSKNFEENIKNSSYQHLKKLEKNVKIQPTFDLQNLKIWLAIIIFCILIMWLKFKFQKWAQTIFIDFWILRKLFNNNLKYFYT